jgi:peptide/nickel transport system substrate-binding protein
MFELVARNVVSAPAKKEGDMKKIAVFLAVSILCNLAIFAFATPDNFLVFLQREYSETLDPIYYDFDDAMVMENMYEGLLTIDNEGNPIPVLATAWKVSDDGTLYTFTLREDVKFHTGNTMTCQDAEYSLRARLLIGGSSTVAKFLLGFEFWTDDEATLETLSFSIIENAVYCDDQNQLNIKLLYPRNDALILIGSTTFGPIFDRQHYIELGGWGGTEADWKEWAGKIDLPLNPPFANVSAGTGAYQLESWEQITRTVTKAFPEYWDGKPAIERVIVQYAPDQNTQVLALKNGDADALVSLEPNTVIALEDAPGITLLSKPNSLFDYFIFNQNLTPPLDLAEGEEWKPDIGSGKLDGQGVPINFFSDIHVRRAFQHAFDEQYTIDAVYNGNGQLPIPLPAGSSSIGAAENGIDPVSNFNLAKAEEEFKLAWDGEVWDKGFTLTLGYYPGEGFGHHLYVAEVLKELVESLNPKFRIIVKEYPGEDGYLDMFHQAPLILDAWLIMPTLDLALETMIQMYSADYGYGDVFKDDTFETMVNEMVRELDPEKHAEQLQKIVAYWQEQVFFIRVPEYDAGAAYRNNLQGDGLLVYPTRPVQFVWKDITKTPEN